jgi:hypothetical protein
MLTIPFLISIGANALIGTLPVLGPIISGFLIGAIIGRKDSAMVVGFLGAIIGGVFCRIFLLNSAYGWHHHLLGLLGNGIGQYAEIIIRGNPFYFVLYFGFLGMVGGLAGALIQNKMKQ